MVLKAVFADGSLPLRLIFWDGDAFDFAAAPTVAIVFSRPGLWRALLKGDFALLGDAHVKGELVVEGDLTDLIEIGVRLSKRLEALSAFRALKFLASLRLRRRSLERDAANVRRHYDVSDAFYCLWLDKRLVYSCAYFHDGDEDIDRAQEQKLDHICRKLMLRPGEALLDVGCGWGALLQWAAERHGVTGHGVTLSQCQFHHAKERLSSLHGKATVALRHFAELEDSAAFDKIASVGMYEHVGADAIASYLKKITRLLKPGGAFLNHGIISPGGARRGPSGGDFIERYVFPGGSVSSLAVLVEEMAKVGLEVIDIEDLRPHYARTLMLWSDGLEKNREHAIELVGAETFRIWRVYLAGMAYAFDHGFLSIAQVLAVKPEGGRPARRPWTRAHQYIF
ncbi:cyclopropane-fatty-acyl-phospholipid synthase family protein [Methylocystis sp. MJC1]|uniref:SAM-dependent methyltransferase n=1 Tax=Methylocystis sp. MJC1 TaxID=2654282 RepID=UPI0019D24718|nr:cyclopropane-fatty-acyl-phospholipid synthase family protein [Methylocystis sp. MJC1]